MTDTKYTERLKTTGRNDSCPCGSGKKYKKCHLAEDESKRSAALKEEAKAKAAASAATEADEEVDTKSTDKSKRSPRGKSNPSGSRTNVSGGKPKNIPRRGAV